MMNPTTSNDPNLPLNETRLNEENLLESTRLAVGELNPTIVSPLHATTHAFKQEIPPIASKPIEKDRYEVLETLGEGGMGVVYLVKDHVLNREVALKKIQMRKQSYGEKEQHFLLWRLKQEASIVAHLEHPNIVPLYEMQQNEEKELQFTMRKVSGKTLRTIFAEKRSAPDIYPSEKLLGIFLKVCDAVSYAHSRDVIHRDLKPDNVMVGEYGEVYVMDWGISKKIAKNPETPSEEGSEETLHFLPEQHHQTIGGLGTPGYMPPEQIKAAANVTAQSDIFALGKILRECFVLLSPMEEFRYELKKYQSSKLDHSEKIYLPKDIEAIVKKATEREPLERYASVKELAEDIQRYLKNFRVSAREYSIGELFKKWISRYRQKIYLWSLMILFLLSFWLYFRWQQKNEYERQFQDFYQSGLSKIQEAQALPLLTKLEKSNKISHFLTALNHFNSALSLKKEELFVENEKFNVGKQLLTLCCELEDYRLARYVVQELKSLSSSYHQETQTLEQFVFSEENRKLKEHLASLAEWKEKLQNPESGMREDALLEISKMSEEEVFQELVQIVQEGTAYFLQKGFKEPKKREYYKIMATALGYLENPKAATILLESLSQLTTKNPSKKNYSIDEMEYRVTLAQALANTKNSEAFLRFHQIRWDMGFGSEFWKRTQLPYNKLFKAQKQITGTNPLAHSAQNLLLQGISRYESGDKKNALENFNQTLEYAPKNTLALFLRGLTQYELGNFNEAIQDLNHLLEIEPNNAQHYSNRGLFKKGQGDWKGAIQDYDEALRLNPELTIAYFNRGAIKYFQQDFNGALEDYEQVILRDPLYTEVYNNRAAIKKELNDFEGALQDFSESIRQNPKNPTSYSNRGAVKEAKKDFSGAIEDYTQAIYLDPQYTAAYNNRANARYASGDLTGAIEDYSEAIRLDPNYVSAYNNRGAIREQLGDLQGAKEDFEKLTQLDPNSASAYQNRGALQEKMGAFTEAIKDYNLALKIDPNNPKLFHNRALAKRQIGDLSGSIHDYSEAIKLSPEDADSYFGRANTKKDFKDLTGALEDYNQAITLNPQYGKAYLNRGSLKHDLGDLEGALIDYRFALRFEPLSYEVYHNRARVKEQQKDWNSAIEDYSEAIRLNPKNSISYNSRGLAKFHQGDLQGAIADYTEALKVDPKYFPAYANRASAKKIQGDRIGALEDSNTALEMDPNYAQCYQFRGTLYTEMNEFSKALEDYNKCISLDPNHQEAYNNRSAVRHLQGDLHGALEDINYLIRLAPNKAQSYYNRAVIKKSLQDWLGALEDCNSSLALNPQYAESYEVRGMIHTHLGKLSEALEDYTNALQLNPRLSQSYNNRAALKHNQGDFVGALEDMNQLLKLFPNESDSYINRAVVKEKMKDIEGAFADYDQGISLNPKSARGYFERGRFRNTQNNLQGAIEDFIQASQIKSPERRRYQEMLAELLLRQAILFYRNKEYALAKETLLLFGKHIPNTHPKNNRIQEMLDEIETRLQEKK